MNQRILVALAFLAASGCITATAKATQLAVPKERAAECRQICTELDMRLSAVVVIHSSAGCVCEPRETEGAPQQGAAAATAAGGAVIQAVSQASQQNHQRLTHSR